MSPPAAGPPDDALAEAARHEAARVVAILHRQTGDFDLAEEAVQEALVSALSAWRRDGTPDSPAAWLTAAARRRAVDLVRRRSGRERLASRLAEAEATAGSPGGLEQDAGGSDDRLGMLFGCCHPALAVEARLALTLRAVVGLTTAQVARAFLVPEATVAQRVVRAKRKIVATGIRMAVPTTDLAARLDDVLTVVYLTYNAGFVDPSAAPLSDEAVWLAEVVTTSLPAEPEAWGLLALLTFQQSRARARFDAEGGLVLLADQDRSRWDHRAIARAERYLERAAVWRRPGRFQLQGAIAACHAGAPTWEETDWLQILTLYDLLVRHDPSPVVRLNRAVALAEYAGAQAALAELDLLGESLDAYHLWHATRADLLRRLGRGAEADEENRAALALAESRAERRLLESRLESRLSAQQA